MPKSTSKNAANTAMSHSTPTVVGLLALAALFVVAMIVTMLPKYQSTPESVAGVSSLNYVVPELPAGNLLTNPWYAGPGCNGPSLAGWTSVPSTATHKWTASDKPSNPSILNGCATAARISVGESDGLGSTVQPDQDVKLYQIVSADPANEYAYFDMYWVAHTMNYGTVTVYGSESNDPDGTWTKIWTPFNYSVKKQLIPPKGVDRVVWLWKCYSDHYTECSDAPKLPVSQKLPKGYSFYKIEFSSSLPPVTGGFKHTGAYYTTVPSIDALPVEPVPTIAPPSSPKASVAPSPRIKPSASPTTTTTNTTR